MSFNNSIPLGTDFILQSFYQLRANFRAINNAFKENHASMADDLATAGQHTALTLQTQMLDPVTSADQVALYQKVANGEPQLFFAPNNSQTPIQMTYNSVTVTDIGGGSFQYTTFLPGPFIIYAGFINNPTQDQLVTLSPNSTLIYVDGTIGFLNSAPGGFPTTVTLYDILVTSFKMKFPTNFITIPGLKFGVFYLAIGKP